MSDIIFNDVSFYKTRQGFQLPETSLKPRYDIKRKNTIWFIVLTVLTIAVNVYMLTTQTVESDIPLWVIVCCPLVALPIVFLSIWFARRNYTPKKFFYILSFLFGAGPAVIVALISSTVFQIIISASNPDMSSSLFSNLLASLYAPPAEEFYKGLCVLTILFSYRRFFNTTHDGMVVGVLVGAGFAFSENILYFSQTTEASSLLLLVVMRSIGSALTHGFFTGITGLCVGYYMEHSHKSKFKLIGLFFLGVFIAASLHSMWNTSASIGAWYFVYLFACLPISVALLSVMIIMGKIWGARIGAGFEELKRTGWLLPHITPWVISRKGRNIHYADMKPGEKKYYNQVADLIEEISVTYYCLKQYGVDEEKTERLKNLLLLLTRIEFQKT